VRTNAGAGGLSGDHRYSRICLSILAFVGVGVLAAACGGGSTGLGVASLGSTTSTTSTVPESAGITKTAFYAQELAYAACMRAHGDVSFPDPNSAGAFGTPNSRPNDDTPQYASANRTCGHLLPSGGFPPAVLAILSSELLKFAQCMRAHGLTNFPDPIVNSHELGFKISIDLGIDPRSPQFQAAQKACRSFLPGGG